MQSDINLSTFICYRRSDSDNIAGRIFDRLASDLGLENVFKDVDSIPLGVDFTTVINQALGKCQVLIVVIGKEWLTATDETGNRRLDNPEDWVRLEIETAFKANMRVVPLLVNGAEIPKASELPRGLKKLARLNAAKARPDPDFHKDMDRLIKHLKPRSSKNSKKKSVRSQKSTTNAKRSSLKKTSSSRRKSDQLKSLKDVPSKSLPPSRQTVRFNKTGVSKLLTDKPVVYKILTKAKNINYVGAAKRGAVQTAILKHLPHGRYRVPGYKVQIIRVDKIRTAQRKAKELINKHAPRYN